jgi:VirK protein
MTRRQMSRFLSGGVVLGWIATSSAAVADSIPKYGDVLEALEGARVVKVMVDLHACHLPRGNVPGPDVVGGLTIDAFNEVPGKGILFSDVHQTLDAQGKPTTAYIRYDLTETDKLTVTVTRFSANGTRKEDTFVCPVPGGARFAW